MSQTKLALGNALKKLVHEKPFNHISISDITAKCGLNRQTFYYHFQDKYECLEWIYLNECLLPITEDIGIENWDKKVEAILKIMATDSTFYMRTIHASPKTFINPFFSVVKGLFCRAVHLLDAQDRVDDEEEEFISEFLTQGIIGIIIAWVDKGMKVSPEVLAYRLKQMALDIQELRKQRVGN